MSDRPLDTADAPSDRPAAAPAGADPAVPPEANWFGYRPVAPEQKAGMVRQVFESVAPRYDLMNDLMSAGIHRLWKAEMVDALPLRANMTLLDVGGGTGDIAFRFLDRTGGPEKGCRAVVCDINRAMLEVGRDRAVDQNRLAGLSWVCGDAERLPVPDRSADAYTIAFCLRNVTHIDRALAEARRVLKPGGRFLCLEFSHVVLPSLRRLYDTYSFSVLPLLGRTVAGDEASYRYLAESIRRFPDQEGLAARMRAAGLDRVGYRNLSGGIAALHMAWRL
ncbi:MAG TPA: class I SAM-dependent methyltransferase [Alphaproteobacteria bacterium]|nr:class I SAM-dependent methyltransferase [Alphaproteobacteria bacterium]